MGDKIVLDGELSLNIQLDGTPDGITEITPSQDTQILQTSNKALTRNIVVNPIPSNYGLVTWNGSVLTVS